MLPVGKILIVDDEPMVTKTLKTLLSLEGYKSVYDFNNPKEAVDFLKLQEVDLIVSDFIMPEMNGLEFLRAAKELQPNCTQMLLTGYADKENAIKAINELGLFKYIEKPWQNSALVLNIKNGLEQSRLKKALDKKILELECANKQLEEYSHGLETIVAQRTGDLTLSNLKLSAIIDNCADGIVLFNNELLITQVNSASCGLFGLDEKELLGKNFFELCISEKNQIAASALIKEKRVCYLRDFYLLNLAKEEKVPVEINIAPVFDEHNSFYVCVLRDVTFQKESERLRDDFIATLTHDLRTPLLAAISGLDFTLKRTLGDLTPKQDELLATMKQSNEDMLGLVNALLEVYRYESGKLCLCKTRFSLSELVEQSIKELEPLAREKNATFAFSAAECQVNADRNELRRVLANLLGNAIKHTDNGTKIEITIQQDGRDAVISVKDDGPGLSEDDMQKLFKRFSQGTSQKRACSTGLGLYLSRQIVEAHQGKIWVESNLEKGAKGSTFSFILKDAVRENAKTVV